MSKVTTITKTVDVAALASLPAYRTRDVARAVAKRMKDAGVTPSAPVKTPEGWRVALKHRGATLTINRH